MTIDTALSSVLYLIDVFFPHDLYFSFVLLTLMGLSFVGNLFLHRFWREHYFFSATIMISTVLIALIQPKHVLELLTISIWQFFLGITMYVFRRDFFGGVADRYRNMRMFLPKNVATEVAISAKSENLDHFFSPINRFVICICCDWRNFQTMSSSIPSSELVNMFEKYYDLTLGALEQSASSGRYYADWTADELFVVFYGSQEEVPQCISEASAFAKALATSIFDAVQESSQVPIFYDIGMSSGFGLVGMMGSSKMKKTTVASNVAGIAKRLESESKRFRNKTNNQLSPVLTIEDSMLSVLTSFDSFRAEKFLRITATSKNLEGSFCHVWHRDMQHPT